MLEGQLQQELITMFLLFSTSKNSWAPLLGK